MQRRQIVSLLALLPFVAGRVSGQARAKTERIAILSVTTRAKYAENEKRMTDALRALGWVEGRNVAYDRIYADDDESRLPALAGEAVARGPGVIYTGQSQVLPAILEKTRSIPVVCSSLLKPVERGLVQSLARPGGNVTGVTSLGWELGDKRLQLLKQAMPKLKRVGVLVNPSSDESTGELKLIERAAAPLGVSVAAARVKSAAELEAAFAPLARDKVEAVLTTHWPLFLFNRVRMVEAATKQRLPVVGHRGEIADAGALLSYSSFLSDQYVRAAQQIDKILKGAKPAELPVEQPTRFEFVVNLKTAKALGVTIPEAVMGRADRVIE